MAAYGVSPVLVLVFNFPIEVIFSSIHDWITKFLSYQVIFQFLYYLDSHCSLFIKIEKQADQLAEWISQLKTVLNDKFRAYFYSRVTW
jgi:hypothetical protein